MAAEKQKKETKPFLQEQKSPEKKEANKQKEASGRLLAGIRIRGNSGLSPDVKKTLQLLSLHKVNHLVLVDTAQKGMLQKVSQFIAFGEVDEKTLALLLQRRGRLQGDKRLDQKFLQEKKIDGFPALAAAVTEKKEKLRELGIKHVFRLHPPSKGFERKGIKKDYNIGGALGYRGADMNKLILRMI
ncbi:MAG: 50S ribosomal protein L30 [Candidatus Diapherotrites archaeon]|nr:50S ribosomal protein L30 [Candidatus Diapherotrites archaeon]